MEQVESFFLFALKLSPVLGARRPARVFTVLAQQGSSFPKVRFSLKICANASGGMGQDFAF